MTTTSAGGSIGEELTIGTTGLYQVSAQVAFTASTAGYFFWFFFVQGALIEQSGYSYIDNFGLSQAAMSVSGLCLLTSGTSLSAYLQLANNVSGQAWTTVASSNQTYLSAVLVSV
jgi:hypothetical protein